LLIINILSLQADKRLVGSLFFYVSYFLPKTFLYIYLPIIICKMKHFENLLTCLKIEWEEDLKNYQNIMQKQPIAERKKSGLTWYPIKIQNVEIGTGEKLYLTIEKSHAADTPHVFQQGSPIALFANIEGEKKAPSEAGVVAWVYQSTMKIALSCEELPDWVEDGKLGVDMLFDDKTYREMEAAVKQIAQADKNRTAELRDILIGKQIANYKKLNFNFENPALNAKQNLAVQKVLEAQDVAIIHGPPGTGKTTTLVEAIFQTLKTEKQVLVTAASNTAVDLLTEKLVAKGISVVRMGNPARINEQLQAYSLDEQIAQHNQYKNLKQYRKDADNYRQLARKYKRNFGAAEREQRKLLLQEAKSLLTEAQKIEDYILEQLLSQTQVITATLTGVATQYLKKHQFSTVFIDEAAQALEPACWIPLLKAQRVVMAGDHCQLPPTVKSFEAEKKGLSRTLFEQTIANQQRLQQNVDVMLEVQYRMHKAIMQFSNQQFYKNRLQAAESVADRHLSNEPDNPLLYQPFEWIDTAGCGYLEVQDDETASLKNPEEAELLLVHLQLLWNNLPLDLQQNTDFSIGIISPYKAQVKLLAELVRKLDFGSRVSVNTVDGFQGQERNIIYISMVRSNDVGEIGFLKDTRRMNVAMTRAKQKLVMVGDSSTLSNFAFYEELLRYVEQIEAYRSAWELL